MLPHQSWMRPLLLVSAYALCAASAAAQTGTATGTATGAVTGRVTTLSGEPLAGVLVTLSDSAGRTSPGAARLRAQSTEAGTFTLPAVPAGVYTLRAWRLGFDTLTRTVRVAAGDTVRLTLALAERAGRLAAVEVRAGRGAYRADSGTTATRTPTPLRDVPQAMQVLPQAVLRDQQAVVLADAMRNVAGVTAYTGYNDYAMRGFRGTGGNYAINGQRGAVGDWYGPQVTYAVDRVEVLKGPASVLFSTGAPGGVINVVTKQPERTPRRSLDVAYGSFAQLRATADVTGPADDAGTLLYRLVAGVEDADAQQRFVTNRNYLLAPALTWAPSERTTLTAQGTYFRREQRGGGWYNRGILAPNGDLGALPLDWTGHEPDDRTYDRSPAVQLSLRQVIGARWTLNTLARAEEIDYRQEYHHLNWGGLQDDGRTLTRHFRDFDQEILQRVLNVYAVGQFRTAGVGHTLLLGADGGYYGRDYRYSQAAAGVPALDIFAPRYGLGARAAYRPDQFYGTSRDRTRILAGYAQDQLDLGARWKALLALRYETYGFRNTSFDLLPTLASPAAPAERTTDASDADVLIPRVGLVYEPARWLSLYSGYSESFEPQYSNLPNAGGPFDPERGRQVEAGAKAELLGGRLSATTAAYRITKANVLTADPANPERQLQTGEVRSDGVELTASGQLSHRVSLVASYAYNDARVTKSNDGIAGTRLPMAP